MPEPLPLLPLQDVVLMPGAIAPLTLYRPAEVAALARHIETGSSMLVLAQRHAEAEDPTPELLHEVGCLARALRSVNLPDGTARVLVEGLARARVTHVDGDALAGFTATCEPMEAQADDPVQVAALERAVRDQLHALLGDDLDRPDDLARAGDTIPGAERLADYAAGVMELPLEVRQGLLAEPSLARRLERLAFEGAVAAERQELANRLRSTVQDAMDRNQREYFLREQLTAIRAELGDDSGPGGDLDRLRQRLEAAEPPEPVLEEALEELDRMARMHSDAAEYTVSRNWLEWLASMPWTAATEDKHDLRHARRVLDQDHWGLDSVKDRILEYLAVRQLNPSARGVILCFVGPPGVGKTSLVKSIALALGRSFQGVSLGGVKDESEIRGHRRTYIGAMPGRIVQALKRAATRNPVLLLDELDKMGHDVRGDPASALLEVLDPAQNTAFIDHYLDLPIDLSQVMFIATANVEDDIPHALHDRLEVVHLPGYLEEEKLEIARRHLVPRVRDEHGLRPDQLRIRPGAITELIRRYTREAGVRQLERGLARIHRKAARKVVEGRRRALVVTPARLPELMGPPPFHVEPAEQADRPGVAIGLAWTPVGGEILFVEATRFPQGKGAMKLTGSLGDVMKESVEAALSLLRSRAASLDLPAEAFTAWDYHVHVPSGAIPKDGPSAGITMLTALASLISGRRVRGSVAMTGELTLRGKVLPVGGVKEKVLAARRAGVLEVVLPAHNAHDLEDIPAALRRDLTFTFVEEVGEVLEAALERA
ncbi:MAG: endopeptidase La [Alphaproteobacteria bacterium]|nr:endopeptidase La [Alphaproteobacteria bacterium]